MLRRRTRPPVYAGRGGVRREVKSILFGGARRRRRRRLPAAVAAAVLAAAGMAAVVATTEARPAGDPRGAAAAAAAYAGGWPELRWRRSRSVGHPAAGRLVRGVRLPAEGRDFFTWDAVGRVRPNPPWRRHGTDRLIRLVLGVLREFRAANPGAPRVGIGDLSRPRGGEFGARFGGLGHLSHQNGLDVDVLYARTDRREVEPSRPATVDRRLAQDLVDRFVAAGAEKVFVGPSLGLDGPRDVVVPLAHHDDHLHVRIPAP